MKQRVAIARGMAMEPEILLMDEPFAALDALTRAKMQEELLQLWEDTKFTVLFVTHSITEAVRIGNRILLLTAHPGQVKGEINSTGVDVVGAGRQAVRPHRASAVRPDRSPKGTRPMVDARPDLHRRPEVIYEVSTAGIGVVQRPLSLGQRLANHGGLRKTLVLIVLALIWEGYARWLDNDLLFPTFSATVVAFSNSMINGELPAATWYSMKILLQGYACGLFFAAAADRLRQRHAHRRRSARSADGDVQSAAVDRVAAAGDDLVRPRQRRHHLRAHPCRAVVGGAEYAFRLPRRQPDLAHGRSELRPVEPRLRHAAFSFRAHFRASSPASRSAGPLPGAR